MRIKKGDQVQVISGKDKGKSGRVMRVFPKEGRLLVEKVNYRTVFLRRSQQNPKGGITKVESPLPVSNVQLLCPKTGKPSKVSYNFLADGTKQRTVKKSGEIL